MNIEQELLDIVKSNYLEAKSFTIEKPQGCTEAIRATLESAVRLFYIKLYEVDPIWVDDYGKEKFILNNALQDDRFSNKFNRLFMSDCHAIRQFCNDVRHGKVRATSEDIQDLLNKLDKCIKGISGILNVEIISCVQDSGEEHSEIEEQNVVAEESVKSIKVGQTWQSTSRKRLVYSITGKELAKEYASSVPLYEFNPDAIAWFVYMDGTAHGTKIDYMWANSISADGNTIQEQYLGTKAYYFLKPTSTIRLSFQLDPDGNGNKYKCKFVGLFKLEGQDNDKHIRTYKKIGDAFDFRK